MVSVAAGPVTKVGFRRDITFFLALLIGYLVFFLLVLLLMLQTSLIRYDTLVHQQWDSIAAAAVDALERTDADAGALNARLLYLQSRYPIVDAELDMPALGSIRTSKGSAQSLERVTRVTKYGKLVLRFDRGPLDAEHTRFKLVAIICLASAILGTILFLVYLRKILAPIEQMLDHAKELGERTGDVDEARYLIDTFRYSIDTLKQQERELTRLHEAEKARADELQVIAGTLTRSLATGFLAVGRSGEILEINAAGSEILRLERPEVPGEARAVIGDTELATAVGQAFASRSTLVRQEIPTATRHGERIIVGLTTVPLWSEQQDFLGMIVLFTDLTPMRKLEERLRANQALADLGEMSAGIAHEFRNSLATILGYLRLARRNDDPASANLRVEKAEQEAAALSEAVERLMAFARPMKVELQPVDLAPIVSGVAESFAAASNGVRIHCRIAGPATVEGDAALLARAVENLVRNAVEAMEGMSGEVTVSVSSEPAPRLVVEDEGAGISTEDAARLFVPFQSTKPSGFGLGLALTRKIILLHGGSISLEPRSPRGARATVEFPPVTATREV